jgi:hypothetical protein
MLMGLWVSQIVATAARFGVADQIANGVTSSDAIADAVGADREGLYRLLRGAAAVGIFAETAPRTFALTPLGDCLRADSPTSLRDFLIAETAPGHWLPWGRLYDAVKRGGPVAEETLGLPPWEYYAKNPEEGASFARGMGNLSAMVSRDVGGAYDASAFGTIVDVGGSQGVLLASLLAANPKARGILFDLPEVTAGVKASDRVDIVSGSFFESVPSGGDLYILKSILHDWPDEKCVAILQTIQRAARPGAKLLVVEMILPDTPQPSPVALMDLNMLVMLGGRERTSGGFRELLAKGGWTLDRVVPTAGLFTLLEAVRA